MHASTKRNCFSVAWLRTCDLSQSLATAWLTWRYKFGVGTRPCFLLLSPHGIFCYGIIGQLWLMCMNSFCKYLGVSWVIKTNHPKIGSSSSQHSLVMALRCEPTAATINGWNRNKPAPRVRQSPGGSRASRNAAGRLSQSNFTVGGEQSTAGRLDSQLLVINYG